MKKSVLIFVTFIMVSFGQLTANNALIENYTANGKSFTFIENGITFAIFQNGAFDFYLNNITRAQVNYQSNNINISFNAGFNYNAYVQYDNYGAVIQIKNTPVYYDYYGRVARIGNINIGYQNGQLARLGSMQVFYNNYGRFAYYRGYVNPYNRYYTYQPYHKCFVQPYYDYAVVSHRPYRAHYKPQRYAYHQNYSKHNNGKNHNNNAYKSKNRVKTNHIPKKRNETVAVNSRKNVQVHNAQRTNSNSNTRTNNRSNQRANSNQATRSNATVVRKPVKTNERTKTATVSSREIQKKELKSIPSGRRSIE